MKRYEFGVLFEKICWVFRRCVRELRENYYRMNSGNTILVEGNKNGCQTFNSHQNTITHSFSQSKDNNSNGIKERKNSINETPIIKSL
jgi:hypothetical protein